MQRPQHHRLARAPDQLLPALLRDPWGKPRLLSGTCLPPRRDDPLSPRDRVGTDMGGTADPP